MARSSKQIKSDLNRINLETKSINQQMNIITKQYEKLGRKAPKKLQENRASARDIQNYFNTLNKVVDNKIEKQTLANDIEIPELLKQFNEVQADRRGEVKQLLQGYGDTFVKAFNKGKTAVLGRDSSFSITSTDKINLNQAMQKAKRTGNSVKEYLKKEIQSLKQDAEKLTNVTENEREYIAEQIKELIENQGFSISTKNLEKIKTKLESTDWLGSQKIMRTIHSRIEHGFYSTYKKSLTETDNSELIDSVLSDINKSSHNKMTMYSRIIE